MSRMKMRMTILVLLFLLLNLWSIPGQGFPGRSLAQGENATQVGRGSDDGTVRVDPLDKLHKYRGGYDITNKHYWSSTAYTGMPGYTIGALWLLSGLVYVVILLIASCCRRRNKNDDNDLVLDDTKSKKKKKSSTPSHINRGYKWHLLLATLFTLLAILGSGLVLGGNAKFHSRAKTIVDIIIDTADDASTTIYNTTGAMKEMNNDLQSVTSASTDSTTRFLTSTSTQLDSRAADLQRQARTHRHAINLGFKIVYIVTTVVVSLNLVAVIALLVFGVLKLKRPFYVMITLCWLLTVFIWIFFGIYFFIGNFAKDSCTAFQDFRNDPYNNSLSAILPCDELLSAESLLSEVSTGVYNLVNEVNANISRTQAGSFLKVCNPFSGPPEHNYEPNNCSDDAIRIGDIPGLLRVMTCVDPPNGVCNGGIPITSQDFTTMNAYTTSIQRLLNVYPEMDRLLQCETVKDAFTEILDKHCSPVKRDVKIAWASMAFLSSVMVVLVLIWTLTYHGHGKRQFSDGSVNPHLDHLTLPTRMPEAN